MIEVIHITNNFIHISIKNSNQRPKTQLYNAYLPNRKGLETLNEILPSPQDNTIIVGDFNAHNEAWACNPVHPNERAYGTRIKDHLVQMNLTLISKPGIPTRIPQNSIGHPSTLDLIWSSENEANSIISTSVSTSSTTSDHLPIQFIMDLNIPLPPIPPRPNWKKADWDKIKKDIANSEILKAMSESNNNLPPFALPSHSLDQIVQDVTDELKKISTNNVPTPKNLNRTKRWWNKDLTSQRNTLRQLYQAWIQNRDPAHFEEYRSERSKYKKAIAETKKTHFMNYMESLTDPEIYKWAGKDKGFATVIPALNGPQGPANSFQEKADALFMALNRVEEVAEKSHFPYNSDEVPIISMEVIKKHLFSPQVSKAPGHDNIPYSILIALNDIFPQILWYIFNHLLRSGHQPNTWKKSIGVVLAKFNKPDYTEPKAYRIIALIPTLSKTMERIVLEQFQQFQHSLLHPSQTGSRKKHSTTDALMVLIEKMEKAKKDKGFVTGIVALDVDGGFDNLKCDIMIKRLRDGGIPNYLLEWTQSFLSEREIQLRFDGDLSNSYSLKGGVPQGSPLSPFLFSAYVAPVVEDIDEIFEDGSFSFSISYVDDIALVVCGPDNTRIISLLSEKIRGMMEKADNLKIGFSVGKTEFMLWGSQEEGEWTLEIQGTNFKAKQQLKYLGFWISSSGSWEKHYQERRKAAYGRWKRIKSLIGIEKYKGLPPKATLRLVKAIFIPIITYGANTIGVPNKKIENMLQVSLNKAMREALMLPRSTPIPALLCEAGIPPISLLIKQQQRSLALRVHSLPPYHIISTLKPWAHTGGIIHRNTKSLWPVISPGNPIEEPFPPGFDQYAPSLQEIPTFVNRKKEVRDHNIWRQIVTNDPSHLLVYTDGSQIPKDNAHLNGAGIVCYNNNTIIKSEYWNTGAYVEVLDSEILAICRVAEYATTSLPGHIKEITICTDNQQAIANFTSKLAILKQPIPSIKAKENILSRQDIKWKIRWTPAHEGIPGNEKADKLAKLGCLQIPPIHPASITFLKRWIKRDTIENWKLLHENRKSGMAYVTGVVLIL